MGQARIDFGGSDRVSELIEKQNKQLAKTEEKLKGIQKESKIASKEGQKLWEQTRTPLEDYQRSLQRHNQLLKAGTIDQETYGRAVERAKEKLKRQEEAASRAIGPPAIAQLKSYIAQMVSLGAGIGTVTRLFGAMAEARREAAEPFRGSADALAQLAQVSAGDPEKFQRLSGAARSIFRAGGTEQLGGAADLAFALESAGALGELPFFQRLSASRTFGNLPELIPAAKALQSTVNAGSFQEILSQAIGASGSSPALAEKLLLAASRSGGSAEALGLGSAEVLGATAIAATATGRAETGGTALSAFLRQAEKSKQLRGVFEGGLVAGVRDIDQRFQGDRLREALGGDSEAIKGFRALAKNADALASAIQDTREARRLDRVGATIGLVEGDVGLATVADARRARARRILAGEGLGLGALATEAARENLTADLRQSNRNQLQQSAAGIAARAAEFVGAGTDGVRTAGAIGAGAVTPESLFGPPGLGILRGIWTEVTNLNRQQAIPTPAIER